MVTQPTHLSIVTTDKAEPRRISFDVRTLRGLPCPPPRRDAQGREGVVQITYWDDSTPGFGLRLSSTGARVWTWMGRVVKHGKKKVTRYHLGPYTEREAAGKLTLAQARAKAHGYQQEAGANRDPGQPMRAAQAEALEHSQHTFARVADRFLREYRPKGKPGLRPRTTARYRGLFESDDFAPLQERPLASLTKRDIDDLLHRMALRGVTIGANRALSAIRKLLKWAATKDYIQTVPTVGIEAPAHEIHRTRHLYGNQDIGRPSELALYWRACEACGPRIGAFAQLLLLTGQRRNEVANMTWQELLDLNGPAPRWFIPPERAKTEQGHVVPLGPMAVSILRGIQRAQTTSPVHYIRESRYVFAATGTKRDLGFSSMKRTIDRQIAALIQAEPTRYAGQFTEPREHPDYWRFHDLRRTVETGLASCLIAQDIRDAILNHGKEDKIQKIYNQATYSDEKRAAVVRWEQHLRAQIAANQPTPVRRKRK